MSSRHLTDPTLAEYKRFAAELAELSAGIITRYFLRADLSVERKTDQSPVTIADREAERVMRERIEARYPQHGIIGEEFGTARADAEIVWVLDPIDGTISFTHGVPLFGTLIGLLVGGEPALGVINQPIVRQLMIGDGKLTTLNGHPVRMRAPGDGGLADATLLFTDPNYIERYQEVRGFEVLRRQARVARTWGDCYGYLLVAAGAADIMIDPIMNPWDLLPLIPVIEGAGGKISAWDGSSAVVAQSSIAAHPALHQTVIEILNS